MKAIDLNCDLGESFGAFSMGMDQEVMSYISSANVACGWHGGDPSVMGRTVEMAAGKGVRIGAHPSFPDLMGFGRREMALSPGEAYAYTLYQLGALGAFCAAGGINMQHVKPHGAMYNMACKDLKLATEICKASRDFDPRLAILAPVGSKLEQAAGQLGLPFAGEFFADRAYNPDGSLVPRSLPGAIITDAAQACGRTVRMAREGVVECIDGSVIKVCCISVCVHGDNAHAVELVSELKSGLEGEGIAIRPLGELL